MPNEIICYERDIKKSGIRDFNHGCFIWSLGINVIFADDIIKGR